MSLNVSFPSSSRTDEPEGDEKVLRSNPHSPTCTKHSSQSGAFEDGGRVVNLGSDAPRPPRPLSFNGQRSTPILALCNNHHCCLVGPTTARRPCGQQGRWLHWPLPEATSSTSSWNPTQSLPEAGTEVLSRTSFSSLKATLSSPRD